MCPGPLSRGAWGAMETACAISHLSPRSHSAPFPTRAQPRGATVWVQVPAAPPQLRAMAAPPPRSCVSRTSTALAENAQRCCNSWPGLSFWSPKVPLSYTLPSTPRPTTHKSPPHPEGAQLAVWLAQLSQQSTQTGWLHQQNPPLQQSWQPEVQEAAWETLPPSPQLLLACRRLC